MKHKRLLTAALSLFAAVPMAFAFSACDDFSEIIPKPPITDEQGNQGPQGNQGEQGGSQDHTHSADTWEYDETSHWKTCKTCGKKFAEDEHDLEESECSICGYSEKSDGLKFVLDEKSDTYTVKGINDRMVQEIVIPSFHQGKCVTAIGDWAFYMCLELKSVKIPDSVTKIGDGAFWKCTGLKSINIPDSVTEIGGCAFLDCQSLISVTISKSMTEIGFRAFEGCTSLMSVEIPDSVTTIGYCAFCYCTSFTSIEIPDSVTTIGGDAFASCTSLMDITIGSGVTTIEYGAFFNTAYYNDKNNWGEAGVLYIENHLIDANKMISGEYQIKDGTKTIGENVFYNCSSLTKIEIPDSVTTIGENVFYNCSSLTSIKIPDSVTTIGKNAFMGCTSLTSIQIPDNVTAIGEDVFYHCESLTEIIYQGTKEQWNKIEKSSGWRFGSSIKTIHCKDGDISL